MSHMICLKKQNKFTGGQSLKTVTFHTCTAPTSSAPAEGWLGGEQTTVYY